MLRLDWALQQRLFCLHDSDIEEVMTKNQTRPSPHTVIEDLGYTQITKLVETWLGIITVFVLSSWLWYWRSYDQKLNSSQSPHSHRRFMIHSNNETCLDLTDHYNSVCFVFITMILKKLWAKIKLVPVPTRSSTIYDTLK